MKSTSKKALILVDIQNDFCPGGSLAVPYGDLVIPIANHLTPLFDIVVATKDWHPANHMSFASNHPGRSVGDKVKVHGFEQILWPDHCIQNSPGSEFHQGLDIQPIHQIFHKGADPLVDSYSAFFDNEHLHSTGLETYLRKHNVNDIYLMGLATDYCVKYSCLDGIKLGFNVYIIEDGCRGVELKAGDTAQAMQEMQKRGAKFINSTTL